MHHFVFLSAGIPSILYVLIIGAIAGILSGILMRRKKGGLLVSLFIGIGGALLGSRFLSHIATFTTNTLVNQVFGATIAALILTFLVNKLLGGTSGVDRTDWKV